MRNGWLTDQLPVIWWYGAALISAIVAMETLFSYYIVNAGGLIPYLDKLSLGPERTVGTWWAGVLPVLAGLHAFDGYAVRRQREPRAAAGWALVAVLLLLFSADELSSLHERLQDTGRSIGIGQWLVLLPLLAAFVFMVARALNLLWSGGENRRTVWLLFLAFALLGTVPLQECLLYELLQHDNGEAESDKRRFILEGIEEGTELLAMMILLTASMRNTFGSGWRQAAGAGPAFEALRGLRLPLVVAGLALTPVLAGISTALSDHLGRPADWLAALAFLLAALVPVRRLARGDDDIGWPAWGLSAACLLASVAVIAIVPTDAIGVARTTINARMLILSLALVFICAIWASMITRSAGRTVSPAWVVAAGALAIGGLFQTGLLAVYAIPPLLGLLVYYVNSRLDDAIGVLPRFSARAGELGWRKPPP